MDHEKWTSKPGWVHNPTRVIIRWIIRTLLGTAELAILLFWIAGEAYWAMGWVYLGSLLAVGFITGIIVDPSLLVERSKRRHASQKSWDRILFGIYGTLTGFLVPAVAALDLRLGWGPAVPDWLVIAALAFYILGWVINMWAMRANKFFAQVVRLQTDRCQTVMTSGPYRWIRHPGYLGGVLLSAAMPLVLESAWALLVGIPAALLLIVRTALEDRMLLEKLDGYRDYSHKVPYRLLPHIW